MVEILLNLNFFQQLCIRNKVLYTFPSFFNNQQICLTKYRNKSELITNSSSKGQEINNFIFSMLRKHIYKNIIHLQQRMKMADVKEARGKHYEFDSLLMYVM